MQTSIPIHVDWSFEIEPQEVNSELPLPALIFNQEVADSYELSIAEKGRELWRELFLQIQSAEELEQWEAKIPRYGCQCRPFYRDWKAKNAPVFPLSFEWKHALKSAVNNKLGHKDLDVEVARQFWHNELEAE